MGALEIAKDITYIKELSERLMDLQNELNINNQFSNFNKRRKLRNIILLTL